MQKILLATLSVTLPATLLLLFALPILALAASQSMCPDKVLETNTIEGIYQGSECGDTCYASVKLDNGEIFTFICDEDDAAKTFGTSSGQKVSVTYEVKQFWNELGNECSRLEVYKAGGVIAGSKANKITGVYTSPNVTGGVSVMQNSTHYKVTVDIASIDERFTCGFEGVGELQGNHLRVISDPADPNSEHANFMFTGDTLTISDAVTSGCGAGLSIMGEYHKSK